MRDIPGIRHRRRQRHHVLGDLIEHGHQPDTIRWGHWQAPDPLPQRTGAGHHARRGRVAEGACDVPGGRGDGVQVVVDACRGEEFGVERRCGAGVDHAVSVGSSRSESRMSETRCTTSSKISSTVAISAASMISGGKNRTTLP